ncbi:hypothetical protein MUP37_06930, partial [Candidatus Bathyarchaeota archaeon]|nr:hypothetical protein [Candidatus Bathyarchaeota archaeon]
FYLILLMGMLVNRLLGKISSLINSKNMKEKIKRTIRELPPFAFVACVLLVAYMNAAGVRFAVGPSVGGATLAIDLGITGPFVLGVFFVILMLFRSRAKQRKTL